VTPKQREFLENRARFRAFIGGWGCGKTTAGCLEAIRVSLMYEGCDWFSCEEDISGVSSDDIECAF
jgi:hypothetical protein